MRPTPGRIVWYQTDGRNFDYYLPALVNITTDNLVDEAVNQGLIPALSGPFHVHLWVPGGKASYYEFDVPYDSGGSPRSWRWPDRVDNLRAGVEG